MWVFSVVLFIVLMVLVVSVLGMFVLLIYIVIGVVFGVGLFWEWFLVKCCEGYCVEVFEIVCVVKEEYKCCKLVWCSYMLMILVVWVVMVLVVGIVLCCVYLLFGLVF